MEDAEQAEGSAEAIRAFPEGGGSEEMRCEKSKVMWIRESGQKR
jgi:hypothetical protein